MKTSYSRLSNDFEIAWPQRVSRHDLVYLAPPSDPLQYGMPIGNGDLGALIWCDDRRIYIAFNKCDLWDDAAFGPFLNWKEEEEEFSTTLRHGCRIVIDFKIPVFDTFYLKDFKARLRLKDGCAVMDLDSPFGTVHAEFFITYEGSVLCGCIRTDLQDEDGIEITLERYGSRTFSHWYAFHRREPELGLLGTESWVQEDCLFLKHPLSTGDFMCVLKPEGEGLTSVRKTSHMTAARACTCPKELRFYAFITSPFEKVSSDEAVSQLEKAGSVGYEKLREQSEACWKHFWETSFLETDDDYLDNLWHLTMYYSCAGQRGRYPGRFINSLWNWNRDVQNWNFIFHWNQQTVYWGLNAAGHHELCESYLNLRFDGMGPARESAERLFGLKDAIFVSDVTERRGYNSSGEKNNHTPVGEIALDFWRQYQYTGDTEFLKNKALPYILGAARFAKTLYVKEADGLYHGICGNAYEGHALLYDSVTELAMGHVLFGVAVKALEAAGETDPDMELYRQMDRNMAPIRMLDIDPRIASDSKVNMGMFKGYTVPTHQVLSLGKLLKDDDDAYVGQYIPQYRVIENKKPLEARSGLEIAREMLHGFGIPNCDTNVMEKTAFTHPQANVSPVHPMNMIGLKDKGTPLFDAAVTTALTSRNQQLMGWDQMPIVLARLGLSEAVDLYLRDYASIWQYYNNGFSHYGPNPMTYADSLSPFRRREITDVTNTDKFWAESFPFRHMGLEPLGILAAIMNERLLQSFDEVIRIVPSYGNHNGRFKLHAVGGFVVMSEITEGTPAWVAIRSNLGNNLKLVNPWTSAWCDGMEYSEEILEIPTQAGVTYFFTPDGNEDFEFEEEVPQTNQHCKVRPDRNAMLGMERCF